MIENGYKFGEDGSKASTAKGVSNWNGKKPKEMEYLAQIEFNSIKILNSFNAKWHDYSVYFACRTIRNNLTVSGIDYLLSVYEKQDISEKQIRDSLKRLRMWKFIKKDISTNKYNVVSQEKANTPHLKFLKKTFHFSKLYINEKAIQYFKSSSCKNLKDFLLSSMIDVLWDGEPVTRKVIQETLCITEHALKQLAIFKSETKKRYYVHFTDKNLSDFKYLDNDYIVCLGCYFRMEKNPILAKLFHEILGVRFRTVEGWFKKVAVKTESGKIDRHQNGKVKTEWKSDAHVLYRRKYIPFFSDCKKNHIRQLTENSLFDLIRNRDPKETKRRAMFNWNHREQTKTSIRYVTRS